MKEAEKEKAVKLIKEWQEKRPDFSRHKLSQATGLGYRRDRLEIRARLVRRGYPVLTFGNM